MVKAFKRIKKKNPKYLDDAFHELHDEAFAEIDCLNCGNCCKTTSPIFRDVDIKRIAKKLKMPIASFEKNFLRKDEDEDWVLISAPCHFLNEDNSCSIYDFRPQACREYPHTDRKKMSQILLLTQKNTEVCPAVAKISLEVIKKFN
ncbi:MAG: YkgJ family cysteine cluster protein [Crocinitomicaceae bacterium]|nr:YkgJ family cysteine cluster protein [Crocinitomicaceae bacterium]